MYSENKAGQLAEQYSYLKGMEINGREIVGIEVPEVRLKIGLAELNARKKKDPDYENREIERLKKSNNWKVLLRLDNGDSYDLEHGLELLNIPFIINNNPNKYNKSETTLSNKVWKLISENPLISGIILIIIGIIIKLLFNL